MIEFTGIDAIEKKLTEVSQISAMEAAMGKACALVEASAKENAPKDTGELRRSISSRIETEGGDIQGVVFTPLEYAPYIEYGTGLFAEDGGRNDVPWRYQDEQGNWHTTCGMKPQPYLRPALDSNREAIVRLLQEGLLDD